MKEQQGHTPECPKFETHYPWQCDCRKVAAPGDGSQFWNGILADHAASQIRATKAVTPATYRGWSIKEGSWPEPAFMATGPNYDAWTDGEGDWADNGEKADGKTLEECRAGIDAWIEENEHV